MNLPRDSLEERLRPVTRITGVKDADSQTFTDAGGKAEPTGQADWPPKVILRQTSYREFLDEQEDYLIAVSRLEGQMPSIPLSKVVKRLGLER